MTGSIPYMVLTMFTLYTMTIIVFLILENRRPSSTFAWMLLFYIFPIGGVVIYFLFGRDLKAFSREKKLTKQQVGGYLTPALQPLQARQNEEIEKLKRNGSLSARKIVELASQNSRAP